MKNILIIIIIIMLLPIILNAQSVQSIIDRVDANQVFVTFAFEGRMEIYQKGRKLVKVFTGFAKKQDEKSFLRFKNPEDYNVKYLRIDDELWIYFPKADDIMKISGHMLKQGMMGSDISYEDMLETEKLSDIYYYTLLPETNVDDVPCYVVELNAKKNDAKYAAQKLYVDKNKFVPLKVEMYAKGGRLIKEMTQSDIRKIGGRYVPFLIEIRDVRKKNTRTVLQFTQLSYDINVPDSVFSKQNLRK